MSGSLQIAWSEWSTHLSRYVFRQVRNEEVAKDIVQDVFMKVQTNLHTLQNERKLDSWIFSITRNRINDFFREKKKSNLIHQEVEHSDSDEIEDETAELSKCLRPMIELLPAKYREAVTLADLEGMTQKQLAEHLNISYSGAKSRVQRGREKLKEAFLACCQIDADVYGNVLEFQEKGCCGVCD